MTAFNFRSLLLAAIVISNCITWTASRHHYAHNVHQHRTRHRRQGAGLYLSASYVIPGGEGDGPWGEWGEVSPCSRTCGGGVASQKRICLQPGPEGQSQCTGGDTKYFSCQTQDCPDGSGDFRAEQCAEFNDKAFRGFKYNWVPYTKAPNPCELNCMPHGERFYFRHKLQVIDGTRCNDESFDVCVNGQCQPVGCDMMLNSTAREDKCRECRGNGANCHTTEGIFDSQDLIKGYNDILLIPAGSTSIIIAEVEPSNNYLALRAKNGTYYLNGHYHIDFPRTITIAGALWTYERSQQGFAAPDKLRCLGPTNEPLYLSLLLQDDNVGIRYEYSVPNNSAPPTDKRYNWVHEEFTPCSATCGGGFQTRNVTCRSREELEIVDDNLCDEGLKPPTNQSCSPDPCPPQWVEGPWGGCSQRCGEGGVKSREVTCQKIIAYGASSIVPDKECFDLLGPKPEVFQKCNEDAPCPTWFVGQWKPCDQLCDEGTQTRNVVCYQKIDGRIEVLSDTNCTETKPDVEQTCMLQPCDGVDWVTSDWSGCDSCTSKIRTRVVVCSTKGRQVLNDSLCSYHNRPADQEECDKNELPACEVQWYATQWSKCSVNCGEGVQTRKVFCGTYYNNTEGEGVEEVKDAQCAKLPKYNDTKPCTVPKSECPSQWFAGSWSACTKECGGGEQHRTVMCFRGDKEAGDCDYTTVLDPTQLCNPGPCDPDNLLPVSSSSTVVMDEEEYCDDEDYPEVGLDAVLSGTTLDIALSDSPGYAEHESTPEFGSGFGSSLSTDDLTSLEGSGFSSVGTTDTSDSDYTTDEEETGSGFTSTSNVPLSTESTTTTFRPPTKKTSDGSVESTTTSDGTSETESSASTDFSESSTTGETDGTPTDSSSTSSDTGSTSSTDATVENTGSTDSSESTSESGSTSSGASSSSDTDGTGPTTVADTGSTESSVSTDTKGTESTDETTPTSAKSPSDTDSTVSGGTKLTESTVTGETTPSGSTFSGESTVTEETTPSDSTVSGETSPSESTVTEETSPSESTITEETESTESTITEETSPSESTITEETSPSESTITEETESTESTITEETSPSESTITEETSPSESTITEETSPSESTITEETSPSESTITEETSPSESTITEETESTESTITAESESTESTITEETSPSESTITEETTPSGSTVTEETESTESTITDTSETGSSESESTNTGSTEPGDITSTTTGETGISSSGSTDSTTTTRALPTESTTTTLAVSTASNPSSTEESTIELSTDSSESTKASTDTSESTVESSTSSGIDSTSTSGETGSSTVESSTTSESSETTEASSTVSSEITTGSETGSSGSESTGGETSTPAGSESTTEAVESSSMSSTGAETSTSSESESTAESTESGSTSASESTSEESGSSTEESTSVSEEITTETAESSEESTTESGTTPESTGSEESTFSTTEGSTIEGSTGESESTVTELSTTEGTTSGTTIWIKSTVLVPGGKVCKPRRKSKCNKTKFGCCPDKKTTASGPFDEGCPKPRTCKESTYGCCPDGLSPAQGTNNEGCPVELCADTLFGCCTSDNTTAAQGNDQEGCPPPPPPCFFSDFGCCADNETEASGPDQEGCPENETTTTEAVTETTSETTESTESIETSEGSTTTEETTDFTSTSTLEPCSGFEFGCCADNETEASGPNGEGCPCNATEFGCCPDGVSPALGLEDEGCQGDCRTSPHGCCEDDKTPAHGPDYEGCCLLQAFGCCPDNRKPAEGPHLEGCGCQHALHGCCPDNVTIAQGPDNQGCGCQYTEHGCCPDRHTAASGPSNEGCACDTFQFGCCADGVTNAKGPDQQGCHCRESTFGCCGDGETHATGPDAAGCDCSSSQHGCCPDGLTEATGPKFLGCTDAPENKQAACSMSTDPGPCHNFTAMWYYDLAYGGCSRFWYGGCEGNGNRFATKEECEDVCVQPSPKDACKLPSVKGACDADYQRWHFNSTREQCIPFRYGGCLGNANNFETRELCQKQCEPSSVSGQCDLPIDQGTCAGNYSRWGFNSEAHRCEQFIWGGCEGNSNRFSSEAACQMRCAGTLPPMCTQPQEAGNCSEKEALWSFSQSENRCLPFYYTGCGGNENRFRSRETCEETCPSAYVPDKCTLPAETGQCSNYREKWFYDTTFKRCRQFYYGGCGGNENNFNTEAECENSCSEIKTTTITPTTTTTTTRPAEPEPQPGPEEPEPRPSQPERSEFCFNAIDAGPCNNFETRYAYDSALGRCVTFEYGGCGGNQNNFPDEAYCTFYCQPIQDICQLPMLQGPCEDSLMRWFYDPTSDSCSQFTYGGCEGNDNRFESLEDCENRCRTGPAPLVPTTTTPATTVIATEPSECRVPESLEDCRFGGVVWYFDPSRRECVSYSNQETGTVCRHTGTFYSQEACERSCGAFQNVDVCKQRKDPGPCQAYIPKVYFDQSTGQCHEFVYGGCLGGANRFSSIEECSQICQAEIEDVCTLPPEQGNCFSYIQQWYYEPSRDECSQFIYTGCSGNGNRFESQRECEARCRRPAPVTTIATPAQQLSESECKTPSSLAPCGNNVTVFYYDSESRQCLVSGIGGCGHPNSYSTEEECERTCGAFRGQDVCGAHLDPGPCRASIPKIYWDAMSGTCQQYAYGGCDGGPNRFSNVDECMKVCGDTGPARECLQEVDTGHSCEAAPAPRWHYSVAHVDCVVFAYLGCGGNDNNFRSYAHCAGACRLSRTKGDDPNQVLPQDCTPYQQECEAIVCQYGVDRFAQDGCQRCQCREDPCIRANCSPSERCVAFAMRDPATQEAVYTTRCVAETNDVYDCDEYAANCSRLRCEYGIQRTRLPDGCEKCSCIQVEIDCEPLKEECNQLKCNYGIERAIGTDGCERCKCKENPCGRKSACKEGERCVVQQYMNGIEPEPKFTAECRPIVKAGACPLDSTTTNEVTCRRECQDDADCRGVGKCCRRGCSDLCLVPVEQTSPHPLLTTTIAPNIPAPPQALPQPEPQVSASEGGAATLRCLFHGNPPPKITWRFGELTIDGNDGRYRLMSDGALEIVSLYRNDTGVYICVADNGLGVATQEIHLVVNDPVRMPVGIAGDENAVVTGELGRPLHVRCLAYGYPPPSVFWYRGYEGVMVPYNDAVYEARGNVLLIRSLAIETLGQYTCQAYNGEGKAASWVVYVRAYAPEGFFLEHEYLVPRGTVAPRPETRPPTTAETTTTTTSTTTEAPRPLFTVPVSARITTPFSTLNIGADLRLSCDVDGFPEPDVHWTRNGVIVQADGSRITITGSTIVSRLTVSRVTVADSGLYACHASNPYSSQSDTTQINVQQLVVPAKCTDNPFFANCDLIVRSKFCRHKYYSNFCCKSCVEAGQLDPKEAELQADQPLRKK